MPRLCVRPGCEEPGVVAFGIDPAARVFWLATPEEEVTDHELCARHSARLTVPRGWLLDDRREEHPRLFPMAPRPEPRREFPPESSSAAHPDGGGS